MELNGDATNKVTFTAGGNEAVIGSTDDDLFGNKSTVTFSGTGNLLVGGDENFTVSGSTGSSTVEVGDGTNIITMGGANNIRLGLGRQQQHQRRRRRLHRHDPRTGRHEHCDADRSGRLRTTRRCR